MKLLLLILLTLLITSSTARHRFWPRHRYGGYPYRGPPYGFRSPYGYPYQYPYGYGYQAPDVSYQSGSYNPFTPQSTTITTQPTQQCTGPCVNGVCPAGYACNANDMCCRVGM